LTQFKLDTSQTRAKDRRSLINNNSTDAVELPKSYFDGDGAASPYKRQKIVFFGTMAAILTMLSVLEPVFEDQRIHSGMIHDCFVYEDFTWHAETCT
jgi:hypothetical protein